MIRTVSRRLFHRFHFKEIFILKKFLACFFFFLKDFYFEVFLSIYFEGHNISNLLNIVLRGGLSVIFILEDFNFEEALNIYFEMCARGKNM